MGKKIAFNCSLTNDEPKATWQLTAGILVRFTGSCISKGSVEQVGLITKQHTSSISGVFLNRDRNLGNS